MQRLLRIILLALLGVGALAMPASASPSPSHKLGGTLGQLWTKVLETPTAQNSFGTGGSAAGCWKLGRGVVSPFGLVSVPLCTVKPGTKIYVAGSTFECSTFPADSPPDNTATTEDQLRACARLNDVKTAPVVTVDGRPIRITATETSLLHITLPKDNIFGVGAGTPGLSVGHGWVALLHPLTPGTHTIVGPTFRTKIVVQPGE